MTGQPVRFRVVPQEEGMMLSHLLARRLPNLRPEQGRELVKAGAVYLGHLRIRVPTVRVAPGERITVYPDALQHQELPLDIVRFVHRDETFVVLDKPPGVPVAATKQSARGTLSEALRRVLEKEGFVRPYVGVVHRLDRGASGLVLFTIRDVANVSLHKQFADHTIARSYRVLVQGDAPASVQCDRPLVSTQSGSRAAQGDEPRAQAATTRFERVVARTPRPGTSLLQAELETGRTHQIRVHAMLLGYPVIGDTQYGSATTPYRSEPEALEVPQASAGDGERLHLHAFRLRFEHPVAGRRVEVQAPLPDWAMAESDQ